MNERIKFILHRAKLAKLATLIEGPDEVFAGIKANYGHLVNEHDVFNFSGCVNAADTQELIGFLESKGINLRWVRFSSKPKTETVRIDGFREFSKDDFSKARFFIVKAPLEIADSHPSPDENGILTFGSGSVKNMPKIGHSWFGGLYCQPDLKGELAEVFPELSFRAPHFPDYSVTPFWEIQCEEKLPPTLSDVVNKKGEPLRPENRIACDIQDLYNPQILKYTSDQLVGDWDIRRTHETWHWDDIPHGARPYFICTRRFRDWCLKRRLRLDWTPVIELDNLK